MNVNSFALKLRGALTSRQIPRAQGLIQAEQSGLRAISPDDPDTPALFYLLAATAEYSEVAAEIVRRLDSTYRQDQPPPCSFSDWGCIEAGKALFALYEGRDSDVDTAWQWVKESAFRFAPGAELLATLDLTRARAKKKAAVYPLALDLARSAIRRYDQAALPGMVAVARVTESWLLTQLGDSNGARQSREAAFDYLKGTEDWTAQANILFAEARVLCRSNVEDKGCEVFKKAITLYARCVPSHRSLRRVLLELANVELRIAMRQSDSARARELRESAQQNIERAKQLLDGDTTDIRNHGRYFLAMTNKALHSLHPKLRDARNLASQAYQFAARQNDVLIMARALYKQALIEFRAAEFEDMPARAYLLSCHYATGALVLAGRLNNDRLAARIHTLLGNLYLGFPFHNRDYAVREWEAAMHSMIQHEDTDYVVQEIQALGEKLHSSMPSPRSSLIFTVTDELAFKQPLSETVREVEHSIVLAAAEWLGDSALRISRTLRTGRGRIDRYLSETPSLCFKPGDVIFRVTAALAFSQPLDDTIRAVEEEIVLAVRIRYNCNESFARNLLRVGFEKIHDLWRATDLEAQRVTSSEETVAGVERDI
jgi:hypothetical protein